MNDDELILLAMAGVSFLFGLFVSYFFAKRRHKPALGSAGGVWAVFTAILLFGMYSADGWDALAYVVFLIGVSAPVAVGGLIGGITGWVKSR